jgi:hypothetical protein
VAQGVGPEFKHKEGKKKKERGPEFNPSSMQKNEMKERMKGRNESDSSCRRLEDTAQICKRHE